MEGTSGTRTREREGWWRPEVRATERRRRTAFNYPPTYGVEGRLVCSDLPPRQPTLSRLSFSSVPSVTPFSPPSRLSSRPSPSLQCIKHSSRASSSASCFLLSFRNGKTNSPRGGWRAILAVVLARARAAL